MEKIILFYKFIAVPDTATVMFWQRTLCECLGLKGRIIIAKHGINGTLGGEMGSVKKYVKQMNLHPLFRKIQYKWSDGVGDDFPRLSVKVRDELVTLGPNEEFDVYGSTKGLKPKQWHEYIEKNPDTIILDARNEYESDIGKFKGALTPKIKKFRDIKTELDKLPKDKPILTYCTGDIRCEYLSAYMTSKGFDEVHHLEGGIVKYGQMYGDKGHWEGKCFVFDDRLNIAFSDEAKDIGSCEHCDTRTSRHVNCQDASCNRLILSCENCDNKTSSCEIHADLSVNFKVS